MYHIIDTTTNAKVAQFDTDPYAYRITDDGVSDLVRDLLEQADNGDIRQMNRTKFDGVVAFRQQVLDDDGNLKTVPTSEAGGTSMEVDQDPSQEYLRDQIVSGLRPRYVTVTDDQFRRLQVRASVRANAEYAEGQKVLYNGDRAIVVEVRTETFEGPGGDEVDASDDSPAYIVATKDGAEAATASDLVAKDWDSGVDSPDRKLAEDQAEDAEGEAEAAETTWSYPDSWEESDTPNRIILLDAWSSMGGQFDCGGACCMGTMVSGGMSEGAAERFCASMKDRVLQWEGWRQGG